MESILEKDFFALIVLFFFQKLPSHVNIQSRQYYKYLSKVKKTTQTNTLSCGVFQVKRTGWSHEEDAIIYSEIIKKPTMTAKDLFGKIGLKLPGRSERGVAIRKKLLTVITFFF